MIPEYVRVEARKEIARRSLYEYCKLRYPHFYTEDKEYLKTMCSEIQEFIEQDKQKFLVINLPPRFGKSYTTKNTVEWLFGTNTRLKVMTGSYNETLSSNFARQVRDTIQEIKVDKMVYSDIFPNTKIKYGEASSSMWALEGNQEKNYLATSPTGTATGFGANILIIDDLIKNVEEAYNSNVLDKQWDWFTNTMLSRTEQNWKVIIVMTRWAEKDLAGRILENYDNVKLIKFPVIDEEGKMLCESILNKEDYLLKTKEMNIDIVEANYNQKPIDIKGKLYTSLKTYKDIPEIKIRKSYTDTADTGKDFLCTIVYGEVNNEAYILDVQFTDKGMEITEDETAELFIKNNVNLAKIESNNGGRGFARNVERILKDKHRYNKTVIQPFTQSGNKEARILSSSNWVMEHMYFPHNWKDRFPDFYKHITSYQKKGKNTHDDGPDVLAGIYEDINNSNKMQFGFNKII